MGGIAALYLNILFCSASLNNNGIVFDYLFYSISAPFFFLVGGALREHYACLRGQKSKNLPMADFCHIFF